MFDVRESEREITAVRNTALDTRQYLNFAQSTAVKKTKTENTLYIL